MKRSRSSGKYISPLRTTTLLAALTGAIVLLAIPRSEAAANVIIWDTGSPLANVADVGNRSGWKVVPSELFTLEADPPKAASDPGYYGREYSFKGDAVVENHSVTAVFWSATGRVGLYSRDGAAPTGGVPATGARLGARIAEIVPLPATTPSTDISRCAVLRNADDEVALEVFFSGEGTPKASAVFAFDKTAIVEIKAGEGLKGVSLRSPLEYGIAPAFIGDDLIYSAADYPSANTISIPAEHVFIGLVSGGNTELVTTWPKRNQPVSLKLGNGPQGQRLIESIDFESSGQSLFLAALKAPGIWHKETLTPTYLEKDAKIDWKRPFPARWKTQLLEADVKTTFAFKDSKAQVWRGVPGSYDYPVWFDGDSAYFHLSKKVPPKGESLIYFLEGQGTPLSVSTPVDIMKATLGRPLSDPILDTAGRKLRTHHRRGGDGVHRACTCGCTEAIQAVFEAGEEVAKKEYIAAALDDMIFFVQCHVERIDEYRRFADDMMQFLRAQEGLFPELKPYLEGLEQIAQQIPQEYNVQKENMKSPEYTRELTRQTLALTGKKDTNNLTIYLELLKAWRGMGGAQDYVVAQCHMITRKLSQEAGYGCADQPKAVAVAAEIRSRCRQILRNPDGYEIWANY